MTDIDYDALDVATATGNFTAAQKVLNRSAQLDHNDWNAVSQALDTLSIAVDTNRFDFVKLYVYEFQITSQDIDERFEEIVWDNICGLDRYAVGAWVIVNCEMYETQELLYDQDGLPPERVNEFNKLVARYQLEKEELERTTQELRESSDGTQPPPLKRHCCQ